MAKDHLLNDSNPAKKSDIQTGSGYRSSLLEVKLPVHKVKHSPPSSAKFKMNGAIPLIPLYAFKAWTGKNHTFVLPNIIQLLLAF
jgi:hypothetical protein